jgi:lysyl-tRNA synthetase class 2
VAQDRDDVGTHLQPLTKLANNAPSPELERTTGEKFPPYEELHTDETNQFLQRVCKKMNVECPPPLTNARMIDKLTGEFIETQCVNPTFISA